MDKKYSTNIGEYLESRKVQEAKRKAGLFNGLCRAGKAFGQQLGNTGETFANGTGFVLKTANVMIGLGEGGLVALVSETTDLVMTSRSFGKAESSGVIADALMMKHINGLDDEEKAKKIFIDLGE